MTGGRGIAVGMRLVLLLFCCVSCAGCIIPSPHVKTLCEPVAGMVKSAGDDKPVAGALVEIGYQNGARKRCTTDGLGRFSFEKKEQIYFGYLLTVPLMHDLPLDCDWPPSSWIAVRAAGFRPVWFVTAPPDFGSFGGDDRSKDPRDVAEDRKRWERHNLESQQRFEQLCRPKDASDLDTIRPQREQERGANGQVRWVFPKIEMMRVGALPAPATQADISESAGTVHRE